MLLEQARSAYYEFSKTLSDINRKLGFAGIALIWLFKGESQGKATVLPELRIPALLIVFALSLDFLQYMWSTAAWAAFSRSKEKHGVNKGQEVHAPDWINWPTLALFWSKVSLMSVAYCGLLRYLVVLVR